MMLGWWPKIFGHHKDQWLKFFNHFKGWTRYGDQKISIAIRWQLKKLNHLALGDEKISIAPMWRLKIFNRTRMGDWKKLVTPLCGDQKLLLNIRLWRCVGWWPKNFGHHWTHPHHQMAIKNLWSPKRENEGWKKNIFPKS